MGDQMFGWAPIFSTGKLHIFTANEINPSMSHAILCPSTIVRCSAAQQIYEREKNAEAHRLLKSRKVHTLKPNICSIQKVRHAECVLDFLICRIVSASVENYVGDPLKAIWQPYLAQYP